MMIQSSNPLSLLSGLESNGAVSPAMLAEVGDVGAFTENLMQQLAVLQGKLANGAGGDAGVLAEFQAKAGALDGHQAGQELQNFAAFFGKALPTAKKISSDINLDDTLSALADVLQQLQNIESSGGAPLSGQETGPAIVVHDQAGDTALLSQQPSDLAAAVSAAMQQPILAADVASDGAQDLGGDALSSLNKIMQPDNTSNKHEVFAAAPSVGDKQSSADGAMAGALLNGDDASGRAGQDKQSASGGAGDDVAALTDASKGSDAAKSTDVNKAPFRMAADIAQLDQAVRNDKTVEVPAMNRNVGHPEWNKELGEKLIWMHKQEIPSAELRLNPQHLGPISIKVDVNQDQTTVSFSTPHAAVKDAIEAAIPKLREMLGGQQLNLADVNVSQQQSQQRQASNFSQMAGGQGGGSGQHDEKGIASVQAAADIVDEIEAGRAIAGNGLLSLFA